MNPSQLVNITFEVFNSREHKNSQAITVFLKTTRDLLETYLRTHSTCPVTGIGHWTVEENTAGHRKTHHDFTGNITDNFGGNSKSYDAEYSYTNFPEFLLLRSSLILHLQCNTTIDVRTEFSGCLSQEWKCFLEENYPHFLIVSDEGLNDVQTYLFNFLMIQSWAMKVHVVLSSEHASHTVRFYAYFMTSRYANQVFFKENESMIEDAYKTLIKQLEAQKVLALAPLFTNFTWTNLMEEACKNISLLMQLWPEGSDIRCVLCVASCSLTLSMYHRFLENRNKTASGQVTNLQQVDSNCLVLQEVEDLCRMHCLSVAILLHLPLSQRACARFITSHWIKDTQTFFKMKNWCEYFILHNINLFEKLNLTYLSDLSDEALLKNIAFYYENEYVQGQPLNLGSDIKRDYEHLWHNVSNLVKEFEVGKPLPLRTTRLHFLEKNSSPIKESTKENMSNLGFIPMSCKLVDEFVGDTLEDLPFLKSDDPSVKQKEFGELEHLHSHKLLSDVYDSAKWYYDEKSRAPSDLKYKQLFHRFQRFYGNSLEPVSSKVIVSQATKPKKHSGAPKSKKTQGNKTELIKRENDSRSLAKKEEKEEQKWNSLLIEQELKENFNSGIKNLEDFLKSCKSNSLKFRVEMLGLTACLKAWKKHCIDEGKTSKDLTIAVQMMKTIHSLMDKYTELLKEGDYQLIARCLKYLGFDELANSLHPTQISEEEIKKEKKNNYSVGIGPVRFQLQFMGHYLIRDERKDLDPRVQGFIPDTWQVMKRNEASIMALVNQVAATVANRFDKTLPSGKTLCGVFTSEYRHDTLNCQVHCIGGELGAEVWEHLLVMIRCPFLALSATISNPEHLTEWLQSVKCYWEKMDNIMETNTASKRKTDSHAKCKNYTKIKQSYKVRLVLSGERYNDLEKHICSVKDNDICFNHFHPCAALTTDYIEKCGFPSDFALSPRESIQLYDTMAQVWRDWPRVQELCPEKFIHFKNKIVIKKLDTRKYEEILKEELINWIENGNLMEAKMVLKKLSPDAIGNSENMVQMFPVLIEKLRKLDKLPALCFIFNISDVEERATSVKAFLEAKQESKRPPKADKEVHARTKKLRKLEKSLEKQSMIDQKKPRKTDQSLHCKAEYNNLLMNLQKNQTIPEDCTYADQKAADTQTLQVVFDRVKSEELKALAQRGIGYHHRCMSAKEKQLVEILFRKGFIRVVTATGTLALGVNMPCKSVVFAQNSIYLDALNYRQMSGRAGRRGQDLLGDVYFFDIPLPKIEKLIKSNVPELKGQFPVSITLILKLMLLASKGDDPEDAYAKVLSVLKHSLLSFKQPRAMDMLKLYFLFSLQFLVKEGYIDQEGNPMGFAGLVSHLYCYEPSNLVFVNFLVRGLFHNLCQPTNADSKHFSQDVMEKLMLVLANLFGRKYIPAKFQNVPLKPHQSKMLLDDLPEDFNAALHEYNMNVTKDFASLLIIASKLADMKQEYQLPLSNIKFTGQEYEDSQLVAHLMNCKEGRKAVSPFVCLSGNTDVDLLQFQTINNVILRTIGISGNQVPVLWSEKLDNQGRRMPLSAYAFEFYKHGSLKRLVQDNRIYENEAYMLLKNFASIIRMIRCVIYF
ncbi:PREDICTED: probable ATP-dependent RNA helicase DDX60 [Chrysochloris asiatica]|uniref:Probable ATP-dependent RNA helicase DDX60 n=1 Tax=Chrysochloris asiatica TaxID=185453 RepID=A0A9B0THP3_CHRAS|nr:PREDICTED: probable ATP-dependent RNA helicase DDX60 [Chrysochloris asiatica]